MFLIDLLGAILGISGDVLFFKRERIPRTPDEEQYYEKSNKARWTMFGVLTLIFTVIYLRILISSIKEGAGFILLTIVFIAFVIFGALISKVICFIPYTIYCMKKRRREKKDKKLKQKDSDEI